MTASAAGLPFLLALDNTFFRLVADAGIFAKFILLLLLALSIVSWAVAYEKWSLFRRVERQMRELRADVAGMQRADELVEITRSGAGPLGAMARDGVRALQRVREGLVAPQEGVAEFQRASHRSALEAMGALERNMVVLSTATTASPFLGLLGTCWGIMIAFVNIGRSGSAGLDVVAPGIAEALIATIGGLGTAIPSLVFYNTLTSRLRKIEDQLQGFALGVAELLQREAQRERVVR